MEIKKLCSVAECNEIAVRSLSLERVDKAGLKVAGTRRAYLCEKHYKEFKKRTRKEQRTQQWRWGV